MSNPNTPLIITLDDLNLAINTTLNLSPAVRITLETDLSKYIEDSIDLAELLALLKIKYGIELPPLNAFASQTTASAVLDIINKHQKT